MTCRRVPDPESRCLPKQCECPVQLSEEEAEELRQLQAATGEAKEDVLRRAAVQGIRDLRLEQGIKAFKDGGGSGEAATICRPALAPSFSRS